MSTTLKAMKTPKGVFNVPSYYEFKKTLGSGAYGIVIECLDTRTGERVAIKKISDVFTREKEFQTQVYREIKILKHFSKHPHENVVKMKDLVTAPSFHDFKDVYVVMETMAQGDLRNYIRRGTEFTDKDIQFYLYHILKGLKFVHSAGIMHRDIKPSNILLKTLRKESSAVKICDFGLSKGFNKENPVHTPSYVATRSYRAPEFLLMYDKSSTAADIWAAGTILAEMLQPVDKRKQSAFLQGKDYLDQLNLIVNLCGTPQLPYTKAAPSAQQYLENLPKHTRKNFKALFPASVNPLAIDLLDKMLVFDPDERITVDDALQHPYLESIRATDSYPNSSCKYTFEDIQLPSAEDQMQIDEEEHGTVEFANGKSLKRLIYEELMDWQGISS